MLGLLGEVEKLRVEILNYDETIAVRVAIRKQEFELAGLQSLDLLVRDKGAHCFNGQQTVTARVFLVQSIAKATLEAHQNLPRNCLEHL